MLVLFRSSLHLFRLGFFLGKIGSLETLPVECDLGDTHGGESLPVAAQLFILLLAFVVEDENFRTAAFFHDAADNFCVAELADFAFFASTSAKSTWPSVPVPSFSTRITSPGATRYCLPPARITANIRMPP